MSGRIRSIKPEILEDEIASSLSDTAWRLWVSLWVLADDHGNVRLGERYLAANVWQDTTRDPSLPLEELIAAGFITPYAVRSQRYGAIRGWKKHQRVDNAGKPRVPTPEEDDGTWSPVLTELPSKPRGEPPRTSARATRARAVRPPDHDHDHDHEQGPPTADPQPVAALAAPAGSTEPSITDPQPTESETIPLQLEPIQTATKSPEADVFDHWVQAWKRIIRGTRPPKLDDKRRGKIRARLRDFSVDELKTAIDGLWATSWNIENKHYDIELVCRDSAHVERYMALAPKGDDDGEGPPQPATVYGPPAPPPPGLRDRILAISKPIGDFGPISAEGADVRWKPKKSAGGGS